jgi:hypothetical protein
VDPVLLGIVRIMELNPGLSIPMNIQVSGATMSGSIIASSSFVSGLEGLLLAGGDRELVLADPAPTQMSVGEGIYRLLAQHVGRPAATTQSSSVAYLHMRDASHHAGGARINVGYWRCRLSDVSGWALPQPVADQ